MSISPIARAMRHAGRMAVVAHRLRGEASPACPYPGHTHRGRYWRQGAAEADLLVDRLLDLDPSNA